MEICFSISMCARSYSITLCVFLFFPLHFVGDGLLVLLLMLLASSVCLFLYLSHMCELCIFCCQFFFSFGSDGSFCFIFNSLVINISHWNIHIECHLKVATNNPDGRRKLFIHFWTFRQQSDSSFQTGRTAKIDTFFCTSVSVATFNATRVCTLIIEVEWKEKIIGNWIVTFSSFSLEILVKSFTMYGVRNDKII